MPEQRIASLIPSATEIVCALGLEAALVGRSHECDYPPSVTRLPVCTAPKFDPDGTSYEIDQRVKGILQDALSVYRVDAERLAALAPTAIITQEQCDVCAVNVRDVEAAVHTWLGARPRIVSLSPLGLADVLADIERVAEALGVADRGAELTASMRARMADIEARAAESHESPSVACIEWLDPLMAAGNWMPDLVRMAHGDNLFGTPGQHSPWLEWDALIEAGPEVIVVLPCGFGIERTRAEIGALTEHPAWRGLLAVQRRQVYLADGNQYFNRPGPRLVESLEILAEMLHPDLFRFGHEGSGWVRLW